jgi:hypothetical protein
MLSSFAPWCAETCIGASAGESKKPHQGFAGQNLILHRGMEWSKSTLALGLPEWSGKTVSGPAVAANNATNNKKQKTNLVMSTCGKDPSGQPDLNASYQTPGGYPFTVPIPLVPAPGGTCVNSPYPGPVGINQCYYVPNSTPGACGGTTYCAPYYVQFTETYPPGNYRPKYPVSPQQEQTCSKVVPVP